MYRNMQENSTKSDKGIKPHLEFQMLHFKFSFLNLDGGFCKRDNVSLGTDLERNQNLPHTKINEKKHSNPFK